MNISNPAFVFGGPQLPVAISASQSLTVNISFAPTAPGPVSGQMSITGDAQNSPVNLPLSGTGTAPIISVNPPSVSFGNQTVNSTSGGQTVTVSNTGQAAMSVSQVTVSPSQFVTVGPTPPYTISPGTNVSYKLTFTPDTAQGYAGTFDIASNSFNGAAAVSLSGTGVTATTVLNVSPTTIDFGSRLVNSTSGTQTVTLTNGGITAITLSGASASAPFAVSGFTGSTILNPGDTFKLSVAFTPAIATTFNGTLTITSTAPSSPNAVLLSGTGQSGPDLTPPICGLSNDTSNHIPSATTWKNFTAPAVGGTYADAVYGCVVKRLTDSNAYGQAQHHYYATTQPMSADDTKIVILDENSGDWHIIDQSGNVIVPAANMPSKNHGCLHMWDRTDGNSFWIASGNALKKCAVSGSTVSCVTNHSFSEYSGYGVNFPDETDMTPDGWLPLIGQNASGGEFDVFLYNPSTATKSPVYTTACPGDVMNNQPGCLHKIISGPSEAVTMEFNATGTGHDQGNILWQSPWVEVHYELKGNHHDSGKDLSGNEVAVSEDYTSDTTLCGFNPAVIIQPTNTVESCPIAKQFPTNPGWHVSYRDWPTAGWVIFTAQGHTAPEYFNNNSSYADPSSSNWDTYTNEIVMARIDANSDATKIYRLTLAHTRGKEGFWGDARASISWDGKYVIFDSNAAWGVTGCGSIGSCTDLYLIQIH
jgi:hypothetical protein